MPAVATTTAAATPVPVQDAVERLLLRAKLTPGEWEQVRPCCRLTMRSTLFGVRYRYVALTFPDGAFYNLVEGPSDAPGALAWWSQVLEVAMEE